MKADLDSAHGDRVKHRLYRGAVQLKRQCIACGVVAIVDTAKPCPACGASSFHLIPERRELASW